MSLLGYVEKKKPAIYDVVQGSTANPALRQAYPGCYTQSDRNATSSQPCNYSQSMQGMDGRPINSYANGLPHDFNVGAAASGSMFGPPGPHFAPPGSQFAVPGGQFTVPGSPFAGGHGGQHGMSNGPFLSGPLYMCVPPHHRP